MLIRNYACALTIQLYKNYLLCLINEARFERLKVKF